MFSPEKIQAIVEGALPGAKVHVNDMTGSNDHFEVVVVAPQFEGKRLVERHRMVYSAIGPAVGNEIHALAIQALTPEEEKARS
jgi:stress-induced morphogen